jgi:hypothetical protein
MLRAFPSTRSAARQTPTQALVSSERQRLSGAVPKRLDSGRFVPLETFAEYHRGYNRYCSLGPAGGRLWPARKNAYHYRVRLSLLRDRIPITKGGTKVGFFV